MRPCKQTQFFTGNRGTALMATYVCEQLDLLKLSANYFFVPRNKDINLKDNKYDLFMADIKPKHDKIS